MIVFQISENRTQILGLLDLQPEEQDLFNEPTCCSDTDQLTDGTFQRVQCSWRSPLFTELAHQLDKFFELNKAEKLGQRYHQHGVSIWLLRQGATRQEVTTNVPSSLPRNCYHPNFLASLNETDINLLQIKKEINLDAIIRMISTS
jgi:hypothetical protein